jgi:hypothetical protein
MGKKGFQLLPDDGSRVLSFEDQCVLIRGSISKKPGNGNSHLEDILTSAHRHNFFLSQLNENEI